MARRVTVVNFCSAALDMLDFSTAMLTENAGGPADYVLMTWNATPEVSEWARRKGIYTKTYDTDPSIGYVPNLRAMFNAGYDAGFALNDYVVLVNTDMAFGHCWLSSLTRRATPEIIPCCVHITPIDLPWGVKADLGIPGRTFRYRDFWTLHDRPHTLGRSEREAERGGWQNTASFPFCLHRSWWEKCGPWELEYRGDLPPDRRFLERCHKAGAEFIMCHDSIVYHHEAVERRGPRPTGLENIPESA